MDGDRSLLTPCINSSEDCALPSFCRCEAGMCTDGMAPSTCLEHRAELRACSPSPQTTPQAIPAPRKPCQRHSHDPSTTASRGNIRGSSPDLEPLPQMRLVEDVAQLSSFDRCSDSNSPRRHMGPSALILAGNKTTIRSNLR